MGEFKDSNGNTIPPPRTPRFQSLRHSFALYETLMDLNRESHARLDKLKEDGILSEDGLQKYKQEFYVFFSDLFEKQRKRLKDLYGINPG